MRTTDAWTWNEECSWEFLHLFLVSSLVDYLLLIWHRWIVDIPAFLFGVDRSQGRYSNAFRFINIAMAAAQIVRLWRADIFLHNSVYFWWFFTPGRVGLLETKKMPQRGKTWKISRHRWLKCCCAFDAINFQINKISLIQGKMVSFDPQFVEIQGPVDSNISKRQKWIEILKKMF